jgi:hypothetical protein
MSVLVVDNICTDQDLQEEMKGLENAERVESVRDDVRQQALDHIERQLLAGTPPIYPGTLQDPTELRDAVMFRSLVLICRGARTHATDRFGLLATDYEREYKSAMNRRLTVSGGDVVSTGMTVALHRR